MADLNVQVNCGEGSYSSTAKTALTLTAPANQRLKIKSIELFGKGTSNTDTPVKVEVLRAASITGGTAGTAPVVSALDGDEAETPQATVAGNYSAEPTYTSAVVMRTWEVHPQTGLAVFLPLGQEIKLKGGQVFALRITTNQAETLAPNITYEE